MNVMDKSQFNNPLTNPIAINRVNLPFMNVGADPLFVFYIGVLGEVHFYAFPISSKLNQEETSVFIEKAIKYIKLEYSKEYILVTRVEPDGFLMLQDVDKIIADRKAAQKEK